VRFEPTIPVFERAKTVHTLDRGATVIGEFVTIVTQICVMAMFKLTLKNYYVYVLR
jgi:hypothetical protein